MVLLLSAAEVLIHLKAYRDSDPLRYALLGMETHAAVFITEVESQELLYCLGSCPRMISRVHYRN